MDKVYRQIIDRLPKDWSGVTFRDFRKILELRVTEIDEFDGLFVGVDNTIKLLAVLTGLSVEELMNADRGIITEMARKIEFILVEPEAERFKGAIEFKPIDKVSYGDYITFVTLSQDLFMNLDLLIQAFSLKEYSDAEIEGLSMQEVYAAFFTLQKYVQKYMKRMERKVQMEVLRLQIKEEIVTRFGQKCSRLRSRFSKTTVGTSR